MWNDMHKMATSRIARSLLPIRVVFRALRHVPRTRSRSLPACHQRRRLLHPHSYSPRVPPAQNVGNSSRCESLRGCHASRCNHLVAQLFESWHHDALQVSSVFSLEVFCGVRLLTVFTGPRLCATVRPHTRRFRAVYPSEPLEDVLH